MNRAYLALAVVGLTVVACQDHQPAAPFVPDGPVFQISDGHNGGNAGFFFLAPIRRLSDDALVPKTGFNPDLSPVIEVYECAGTSSEGCVLPLGALKTRITKTTGTPLLNRLYASKHFAEYDALWDTRSLGLRTDRTYRIQVSVGGRVLGFADVDVVRTLKEAARVNRDDLVPLLANLILPIRFWIGNSALCTVDGVPCSSTTIDLSQGGGIELVTTGEQAEHFKVDIPSGTQATFGGQPVTNVTFNLETCEGIDVDLPTFGPCLRLSTDFEAAGEGELEFSKPILVSMCILNEVYHTPDETRQEGLITLHQQDGSLIRALPHADPNCGTIGMNSNRWDWLKSLAARFLAPKPAFAATRNALLHVGAGGETGVVGAKCTPPAPSPFAGIQLTTTCPPQSPMLRTGPQPATTVLLTPPKTVSNFQFALPAKMDYLDSDDASRRAPPGTALPTAVKVTDWDDNPVQGARVTFSEPAIEGFPVVLGTAISDENGVAEILWTIREGSNTAVASGRGIAAQNNYPNATVKPFMPDISVPTNQQRPVALGTGKVTFIATGVTEGFTPHTVLTGLEYPKGLWISHFDAYLTETAGHNTSFGGKTTLLHWTPDGGILQTILTNPVNSDAVVVTEDRSIYLAGYVGSSPGQQGRVSRVFYTDAAGWVETPVTDVAIAAQDMFLDAYEDIYLIGPSDDQEATNIYRLPSGSYDSPVGLATGLGRTWSLVKVGSTIFYSLITSGEVWGLSEIGNALLLTHSAAVTSLTSDGTFLYYGDIGGTIRRRNLNTGADELVTTGPGEINAVRYDPSSGRLYYLRSGTQANQYKDGTLNYITVNAPNP